MRIIALISLQVERHRFSHLPYFRRARTRTTEDKERSLEIVTGLRKSLDVLPGDRTGIDGEMHECHPEFLRNPCKIRRRWLADRLTVTPVAHNAANTLFGHESQVTLKQLPGNIDLGREFEHSYL